MENNVFRKGLVLGIIVLFIGASVVPSTGMVEKSTIGRSILYVGGSGPGNYTTIQSAINAASDGDTVYVFNGTYHEHITVSKSYLNLLGENKETTIIDADGYGQGVDGAGVSIPEYCHYNFVSGFTVMNTTYVGIMIHADTAHSGATANYNTISDCIVRDCTGVGGIRIVGHRWTCHADYNTVINCEVFNISGTGVLIQGGQGYAYYNKIINTTSYNNTGGIHVGGVNTGDNIVSNCEIFNNTEYGLEIKSIDNTVYHNNLLNNGQNAFDSGTNTWYNATIQEGNYYSDYNGTDTDGDGIGDTPYNISGGSNQDLYPLMYPWYPTHPDTVYVDDDYNASTSGFGYDRFNRIQYGINEVPENGTVYVYNGTYYENVEITKDGINLSGEDKNTTIIDARNEEGNGILIKNHDFVNVSGFTIRNAPKPPVNYPELGHDRSGNGVFIQALVPESGAHASYNAISDCIIHNNSVYGIYIQADDVGQNADYNVISRCEIYGNNWSGIRINVDKDAGGWSYGRYNLIGDCRIFNNGFQGPAQRHRAGIAIATEGEVSNTTISGCEFNNNFGYEIFIDESDEGIADNNFIYHNNFLNDTNNAYDECSNFWDNGYPSGGNYWDDYTGIDNNHGVNQDILGSDGIGDIPYNVSGGSNQDLYPFMNQDGWDDGTPVVSFTYTPTNPTTKDIIQFNDTSTDIRSVDSWWWDFGDNCYSDLQNPTHHFPVEGAYNVTLTVTDNEGLSNNLTKTVTITPDDGYITDLQTNWNIISIPYYEVVNKADINVNYNGTDYNWTEAVNGGVILGFVYGWNTTNQNYVDTEILQPGKGYWMYAYYNCKLFRSVI